MIKKIKSNILLILVIISLILLSIAFFLSRNAFMEKTDYSIYNDKTVFINKIEINNKDVIYKTNQEGNKLIVKSNTSNNTINIKLIIDNNKKNNIILNYDILSNNKNIDVKKNKDILVEFESYIKDEITLTNINKNDEVYIYLTYNVLENEDIDYNKTDNEHIKILNDNIQCGNTNKLYDKLCNDAVAYGKKSIEDFNSIKVWLRGIYILKESSNYYFYYSGSVSNNNLIFANKCWKIMRTTDNLGTLLIYNGEAKNNQCKVKDKDTIIGTSDYNLRSDSNTNIGYMFGKSKSDKYEKTHENIYDSEIKIQVDLWYEKTFLNTPYEQLLDKNNIWCNDRSINKQTVNNLYGYWNDYKSLGYKTISTIYSGLSRVGYYSILSIPQIKCENVNDQFSVSSGNKKLRYPIALPTLDDVTLAGVISNYKRKQEMNHNYLNNGMVYWTMTPTHYYHDDAGYDFSYVGTVTKNGFLYHSDVKSEYGIRPTIALSNDAIIKEGIGTKEKPYIIE